MADSVIRRSGRPAWRWVLPVALMLLAQMLGQWHRLAHPSPGQPLAHAHGQGHGTVHGAVDGHAHGPAHGLTHDHPHAHPQGHDTVPLADGQAPQAAGWLQQLFDADGHAASCVLYDQLAHADGLLTVPLSWLPPAWVPGTLAWQACWQLAAQAAGYLARGPPRRS